MTTQQAALDHLRVIRSLLERSQVYRAVSAPAALCGGLMALIASGYTIKISQMDFSGRVEPRQFLAVWIGILMITSCLNLVLLFRQARRRGQAFVSEGMRMAFRAFMPPMLVGGGLGFCLIWFNDDVKLAALVWILCYGLGLLATAHFSPRSLVRLGWAFLLAGGVLSLLYFAKGGLGMFQNDEAPASLFLGLTFGVLHILYAVAVFIRRKPGPEISAE